MVQEKWQTISLVLNDLYFWPFVAGPIWTGVYVCLYSSTLYGILHVLIAPVNIFLDFKDFKQFTSCCYSVLFISFFFLLVNWVPHSFVMYACTWDTFDLLETLVFWGTYIGRCLCPDAWWGEVKIGDNTIYYLLSTNHWPLVNSCPSYWGLIVVCISVRICKHDVRYPPISF